MSIESPAEVLAIRRQVEEDATALVEQLTNELALAIDYLHTARGLREVAERAVQEGEHAALACRP